MRTLAFAMLLLVPVSAVAQDSGHGAQRAHPSTLHMQSCAMPNCVPRIPMRDAVNQAAFGYGCETGRWNRYANAQSAVNRAPLV